MSLPTQPERHWLTLYAKLVVLSVFGLIFLGALVTSWGAGMAVPDWPLSFGSINPSGWWSDFPVRLEHGHRLFASLVGLLTMLLCSWAWRNKWLVWTTALFAIGLVYSFVVRTQHQQRSPSGIMHASLWVALFILVVVGLYTLVLFMTSPAAREGERTVRWLVYASFIAVCLQATLGGLRVTGQTAGEMNLALALRIFHGCVAQAYLCCVVAAAALLAFPRVSESGGQSRSSGLCRLGWVAIAAIYVQLILGAVMRHLGAGLAISTFPVASPSGSYLPAEHNVYVDTNFAHTRVGALLVTLIVLFFAHKVLRCAKNAPRLYWPALTLLALVSVQITLGILVILHGKPPTLTTFHVLNGAALLATAVLLTLRLGHSSEALSSAAAPALSTSSQPAAA